MVTTSSSTIVRRELSGEQTKFLSAPRLDDLQCACASLYGLLGTDRKRAVSVHCVLDNEEVGSTTKQGRIYVPQIHAVPYLYSIRHGYRITLSLSEFCLCGQCP
ncbi:MAG: hypothetical protein ACLTMH_09725 [Faecalimonas umbilicata]|uniref:hypothetical protein n=1 Tax=Faecalimonas umbilicata TaxID=1912855 RepID=UPI003991E573